MLTKFSCELRVWLLYLNMSKLLMLKVFGRLKYTSNKGCLKRALRHVCSGLQIRMSGYDKGWSA